MKNGTALTLKDTVPVLSIIFPFPQVDLEETQRLVSTEEGKSLSNKVGIKATQPASIFQIF